MSKTFHSHTLIKLLDRCDKLTAIKKGVDKMKLNQKIKLVVAGGRDFEDYELLSKHLDDISKNYEILEIVSGTAQGADTLGERYARAHNIPIKRFPAYWNKYGRSAGYIRNKQMVEYADAVLVFWNGTSRGTKLTIDLAVRYHRKRRVIRYE